MHRWNEITVNMHRVKLRHTRTLDSSSLSFAISSLELNSFSSIDATLFSASANWSCRISISASSSVLSRSSLSDASAPAAAPGVALTAAFGVSLAGFLEAATDGVGLVAGVLLVGGV